jgi:hypothetical protein
MSDDPVHGQHRRRGLIWKVIGMWPDPRLTEDLFPGLEGATDAQRLDRARVWLSSASPEERAMGVRVLASMDRHEGLEPLLNALDDPDKRVRTTAFVQLLWHDPPADHGERIVAHLGGESRAAERWVQMGWGPGSIGSLGVTERLLPHLERLARTGARRKDRRRAAAYVRILHEQPPGWPMTGESSLEQSV